MPTEEQEFQKDKLVLVLRAWDGSETSMFAIHNLPPANEGWFAEFVNCLNSTFIESRIPAAASVHPEIEWQMLYDRLQTAKVPG